MSDLLRPELFDEPLARTREEIEEAYGGKEALAAKDAEFKARVAAIRAKKAEAKSDGDEPEDKQIELEDKFLPRRK